MNKFIKKLPFLILTLVFLVACTNKPSKNTSEMDKPLATTVKDKEEKTQIMNIKNESRVITTDPTDCEREIILSTVF